MIMTRASFNKFVLGSSEFGEQYKMILGSNEMKLSTGIGFLFFGFRSVHRHRFAAY